MKRLENKTAIVTGGNSGIGKATAILFAKEGADLVLCARRKEALDEVAEECRKYGVQVVTVKADVSSHEDCSAVVKAAVDTFGKVDILVNNAGIVDKHRPITECTDEWWNEIIAIDQSSLFYMMKDTIPHMMASGKGSIINVSSIGGVFGNGGISYSAAKSAALAMTKNVAIQLAPNGIRCNAVFPYSLHRFQCLWISGRHSHPAAKTAKTNSCGLSHTGSRPCYKSCFSFKFFKYFHPLLLSDNHSRTS